MKTIKFQKLHAFVIFQNLKRTAPKDFADIDEMTATVDQILPALEKSSDKFMEFRKLGEDYGNQRGTGKLTEEEWREKVGELQKQVRSYELSEGLEEVSVELETAAYSKLMAQFEKWGKNWFMDLEDFMKVRKAISNPEGN